MKNTVLLMVLVLGRTGSLSLSRATNSNINLCRFVPSASKRTTTVTQSAGTSVDVGTGTTLLAVQSTSFPKGATLGGILLCGMAKLLNGPSSSREA